MTADAVRSTGTAADTVTAHPQQPRRPQLIADMLKQGQEIIVQIAKEPLGKKGARITSHVALPGRYLVYMPTLDHTGVSRKIASAEERARLRHLVNEAKGSCRRRIHRAHGRGQRAARRSSRRRGIPHAHVGGNQIALRAAQGAVAAAPRSESGRAHPARLHDARLLGASGWTPKRSTPRWSTS